MIVDLAKLKRGEEGERLNIQESYDWIINEMEYDDFCAFAKLRFRTIGEDGYTFSYEYRYPRERDNAKSREDYLKYFMYKLVQNICDPICELEKL